MSPMFGQRTLAWNGARGRSAAGPAIQSFNQVAKCTNHTSSMRSSDPAAARQPGGEAVHEKSLGSLEQPGYP
jgi:hypothetical protein